MIILINTASTYKGGSVQVAQSFLEECKNVPEHEFHVVLGEMIATLINPEWIPTCYKNLQFKISQNIF